MPQVSDTQINQWLNCQIQWFNHYVLGESRPASKHIHRGQGVDKATGADLTSKKDTGILLPRDEVADRARDAVNASWDKQGVFLQKADQERGVTVVRGETVDMAVRLAVCHHQDVAPLVYPSYIQRELAISYKQDDHTIIGYIDVQEDPEPGRIILRDTKTRSRLDTREADKSDQLSLYAMMVKIHDGVIPAVCLDIIQDLKAGPKATILKSTRGPAHFAAIQDLLDRCFSGMDAVRNERVPPQRAARGWFGCADDRCGWHVTCPAVPHL